jgi:hypothetical protein
MTIQNLIASLLIAASGLALANPDLTAPEAAAAVAAGKVTLIDIRTPPEWKETGVAKGANCSTCCTRKARRASPMPCWTR